MDQQAKKDGRSVLFSFLTDFRPLEHSELAKHLPNEQRESRAPGEDNAKDDGGHKAVFMEQGVSASPVAAARSLDTISKLPGMAGEVNDAVSARTQVHESLQITSIARERMPTIVVQTATQSETETMGFD